MGIKRCWRQTIFKSLAEKQTINADLIAKVLTLCIKIQVSTDVEIRFAFDGADHNLHISYICLPKKGDPFKSRDGEEIIVIDGVVDANNFDEINSSLLYILTTRKRV